MPYAYLELSLSGSLTASEQGSLMTIGEFFNISALDPLLPTFLITTLCSCVLCVITYYSLVIAWEVFWASQQSPSPLDPSAEVVLTKATEESWLPLSESGFWSHEGNVRKLEHQSHFSSFSSLWTLPLFPISCYIPPLCTA